MSENTFGTSGQQPIPGQPGDVPAQPDATGQQHVRHQQSSPPQEEISGQQPTSWQQPVSSQQQSAAHPDPAGQQYVPSWQNSAAQGYFAGEGQQAPNHPYPAGPYADPAHSSATQTLPPPALVRPKPVKKRSAGLLVTAALIAGLVGGTGGAAVYGALAGSGTSTPSAIASALTGSTAQAKDKVLDGSVEAVSSKVLPSVVQINVANGTTGGTGSGIILTKDGQILTNNHVVETVANGGSITVLFNDGTAASATVVGRDPLTDIAVIKVEGKSDLTPATLGKSSGLKVGQDLAAIGSPFGLQGTVTTGIVSALNRPVNAGSPESATTSTNVYPAIQTDAAINPGNSGGPLVDMNGNVIGIDASIRSTSASSTDQSGSIGVGFAIPIDLASNIAGQIISGQTVVHAKLGVGVADAVASDAITTEGAQVKQVTAGSAGANAGLQSGDVVTALNGNPVNGADALVADIRSYSPGDKVTLTVRRNGQSSEVSVTLASDGGKATP